MKINRTFIIIFIIMFGAIAGLIFLSLRLSDQQKARAISARSTENTALTQTRLADKNPSTPTSTAPTEVLLLEPSPVGTVTDPGLTPEPMEEIAPTTTSTQTLQTGDTNT